MGFRDAKRTSLKITTYFIYKPEFLLRLFLWKILSKILILYLDLIEIFIPTFAPEI